MALKKLNFDVNVFGEKYSFFLNLDFQVPNHKIIIDYANNNKSYEPEVSNLLIRCMRNGGVLIDVGAHLGFFSILAAAVGGEKVSVVACEPDPDNIQQIVANINLNKFDNISILDRPVSDFNATVPFYKNLDDSGGSALWNPALLPKNVKSKKNPCIISKETDTLNNIIQSLDCPKVKLIKIDTEGAEQKVLLGAGDLLIPEKVTYVIAELHSFGLSQFGHNQNSLRQLMKERGYECFLMSPSKHIPILIPPKTMIQSKYFFNLLFTTQDALSDLWPIEDHS